VSTLAAAKLALQRDPTLFDGIMYQPAAHSSLGSATVDAVLLERLGHQDETVRALFDTTACRDHSEAYRAESAAGDPAGVPPTELT